VCRRIMHAALVRPRPRPASFLHWSSSGISTCARGGVRYGRPTSVPRRPKGGPLPMAPGKSREGG
jgi:hypothetical protein